ncbi:unnamed protein product [Gongylonema pulchrum]|uniref:Tr-type G domain-containing protein n=1 Tax=Gongylonema pulchrum TaxID=637853 RepID=A0A183E6V7_9BILA|nr:unnamed protein product [Gongylonema pulchrum]
MSSYVHQLIDFLFRKTEKLEEKQERIAEDNKIPTLLSDFEDDEKCLPPEVEEGNIEYKVKLINPSSSRMEQLISQMKWRLREGYGEAFYEIGVKDDGTMIGLTSGELEASIGTLKMMASALGATAVVLSERDVKVEGSDCLRRVAEVLVRKVPDSQQFMELRVAILGGADVGKSTLCGVLTQGHLDNGQGKLMNYLGHSQEEIVEQSTKLITLIDLAGDRKYLKTTIYGLTGYLPHFAALVVSALTGPTPTTREHLGLAVALNMPAFVVVTKVDAVSQSTCEKVLHDIEMLFIRPGMERKPKLVENSDTAVKVLHDIEMLFIRPGMERTPKLVENSDTAVNCAAAMLGRNLVPIFLISNVSGSNFPVLEQFLNVLPPSGFSKSKQDELSLHALLFSIEEVFHVSGVCFQSF